MFSARLHPVDPLAPLRHAQHAAAQRAPGAPRAWNAGAGVIDRLSVTNSMPTIAPSTRTSPTCSWRSTSGVSSSVAIALQLGDVVERRRRSRSWLEVGRARRRRPRAPRRTCRRRRRRRRPSPPRCPASRRSAGRRRRTPCRAAGGRARGPSSSAANIVPAAAHAGLHLVQDQHPAVAPAEPVQPLPERLRRAPRCRPRSSTGSISTPAIWSGSTWCTSSHSST